MITLERFRALIDSYGGDLQRWPETERGAARALLAHSAEACALLEKAWEVDQTVASAVAREDVRLWPAGEQDDALARLRLGVGARIAQEATAHRHVYLSFLPGWLIFPSMRGLGMATGGGFAVAAGLVIGLTCATSSVAASETDTVFAILQPAPIPVLAELGGGDAIHE